MSTVRQLADEIASGLDAIEPKLSNAVVRKLSLAVWAMIEAQTPNTVELTNLLPLDLERQDLREQWLRRFLKSKTLSCETVIALFVVESLRYAGHNDQTILMSKDQTDLGNQMAVLMITVRIGDRSLPVTWLAEEGAANIGFARQRELLERILPGLPQGAKVMLLADRFYPSAGLFQWLQQHQWRYRLRLKGNLAVDTGPSPETTTGQLAQGQTECYFTQVRLFGEADVFTHLGIVHESGHDEPWIIAMECPPTRSAVMDFDSRWAIEPTFSDFKGQGFALEESQLEHADRLEKLILIMALAMHWCVRVGLEDALNRPTPLEKNRKRKAIRNTGVLSNSSAASSLGLRGDFAI